MRFDLVKNQALSSLSQQACNFHVVSWIPWDGRNKNYYAAIYLKPCQHSTSVCKHQLKAGLEYVSCPGPQREAACSSSLNTACTWDTTWIVYESQNNVNFIKYATKKKWKETLQPWIFLACYYTKWVFLELLVSKLLSL